jgi:thiol-disulfide isomerase/thioredoxin
MRPFKMLFGALIVAGIAPLSVVAPQAATVTDFAQSAFTTAQVEGKPILVHIVASWCPTCAAQRPILARLEAEAELEASSEWGDDAGRGIVDGVGFAAGRNGD